MLFRSTINCNQSGIYVVRITQAPSCSYSYSLGYNFTLTGISTNTNQIQGVSFFPNPASDIIKMKGVEKMKGDYQISLSTLEGQLIFQKDNEQELNIQDLSNGCYLISLRTNDGKVLNQRIIISR